MAEISVTATCGIDAAGAGTQCGFSAASLDHAALVAAGRSRADGYDLWMYHVTLGPVGIFSVTGANTATCVVAFNTVAAMASGSSDTGYRIVFGDLGRLTQTLATPGTVFATVFTSTYSVPSITLPPPSFPMTQVSAYETKAVAYPDFAVFRRADLNENRRTFVQAEWRDISPEDWYEIRAVVRASRGGVGTVSPSWLTGSFRVRPGTPSFTQDTKGKFSAALELEQALI